MTRASDQATSRAAPGQRRVRRQLVLIALVGLAPVIASYAIYYGWPRDRQVNYGTLHAVPAPALIGRTADGNAFTLADLRGQWVLVTAAPASCPASCASALYAMRQARTIQNAERDRVVRVLALTDDAAPRPELLAEHPDLRVVHAAGVTAWPAAGRDIFLVDPLGNLVLSWPPDPDVKAMARDLARLLRASQIG